MDKKGKLEYKPLSREQAAELLGEDVPVLADATVLGSISSALMKYTHYILHDSFPGQSVYVGSPIYKNYFSIAYSIASDELAKYVLNNETLKPMRDGSELRAWRSAALTALKVGKKYGTRRKKAARRTEVEVPYDADAPVFTRAKSIKTEVRVPPVQTETPASYNQGQVKRCSDVLAELAMKHDWIPPDSMVAHLMGYTLLSCRLARERLFGRGFYLKEGRGGMWRVLGRPDLSKKPQPNGMYTAEEVAILLEKVRKGEI